MPVQHPRSEASATARSSADWCTDVGSNTPITNSDPTGLRDECGSGSTWDTCDNSTPPATGPCTGLWCGGQPNNNIGYNHWGRPIEHWRTVGEDEAQPAGEFFSGFLHGAVNWQSDTIRNITSAIRDPAGTFHAYQAETQRWKDLGFGPYSGGCVMTGICDIGFNIAFGNYYDAGYDTGGLAGDITITVVTAGAGAEIGAGARAASTAGKLARVGGNARFVVDSAGRTTLRVRAGTQTLDVSEHAAQRMTRRGVSINALEATLARQSFRYHHGGMWKTGYHDPVNKIFVGTANGKVTTVINGVSESYINNIRAATP